MDYLLSLYELIPAWLVALALLAAAISWVFNYHWQMRYERMPLYPPMSLGLAGTLLMLALYYIGLAIVPGMPENARAGGARVLLIVNSLMMVVYNGGMLWRSLKRTIKAINHE